MSNPQFFFYNLPATEWKNYQQKSTALLLECQPYLAHRIYKIATMQSVENLQEFACEDKGRTQGWFQCFLGTGIYRTDGKKIKLPAPVLKHIEKRPTGTVTVEGETWTVILNSWVQKMNSAQEKENK